MKKLTALLLAGVLCLSLCACGRDNDPSSATENIRIPDTIATPDYAGMFAEILCSGKWISELDGAELTFHADGTLVLTSDEGSKEATWCYQEYFDSSADLPLPISAELCEDSWAYWGKVGGITGSHDIVVGYHDEGSLVMSFDGQSWIREG